MNFVKKLKTVKSDYVPFKRHKLNILVISAYSIILCFYKYTYI